MNARRSALRIAVDEMSHRVNNALMVVALSSDLIRRRCQDDEVVLGAIGAMTEALLGAKTAIRKGHDAILRTGG